MVDEMTQSPENCESEEIAGPNEPVFLSAVDEYRHYQKIREENIRKSVEEAANDPGGHAKKMSGVGELLASLRNPPKIVPKERIVLGGDGKPIQKERECRATLNDIDPMTEFDQLYLPHHQQEPFAPDVDLVPAARLGVEQVRNSVRKSMFRCKACKNRFGEMNILERHLRDHHPKAYIAFLDEQKRITDEMYELDRERNRMEELMSGSYIPPESEFDEYAKEVKIDAIPLPGENSEGHIPRLNSFGGVVHPQNTLNRKFGYVKKRSPQCPFCDKRFRNDISFNIHLIKKHEECSEFVQCLQCFKCLPSAADLPDHECDLTYLCLECRPIRNMCTAQRLFRHRAKFHRGANSGFRCPDCNLKFLTPRKLRKHRKMCHVFTKTYQCHFCEELFISEVAVTTHERIHTGILKFECTVCDFKANRYLQMEDHHKEHHGYLCSVCQEKCSNWNDMKDHMLQEHSGYITDDCNQPYIESPRVWLISPIFFKTMLIRHVCLCSVLVAFAASAVIDCAADDDLCTEDTKNVFTSEDGRLVSDAILKLRTIKKSAADSQLEELATKPNMVRQSEEKRRRSGRREDEEEEEEEEEEEIQPRRNDRRSRPSRYEDGDESVEEEARRSNKRNNRPSRRHNNLDDEETDENEEEEEEDHSPRRKPKRGRNEINDDDEEEEEEDEMPRGRSYNKNRRRMRKEEADDEEDEEEEERKPRRRSNRGRRNGADEDDDYENEDDDSYDDDDSNLENSKRYVAIILTLPLFGLF
ncbi:unnamed protein product [Caenorhabditis sp. 36 PRJEB53466]|nr:unnamed protein product [Caenorhabditis sp. 36 PRJEB53466]